MHSQVECLHREGQVRSKREEAQCGEKGRRRRERERQAGQKKGGREKGGGHTHTHTHRERERERERERVRERERERERENEIERKRHRKEPKASLDCAGIGEYTLRPLSIVAFSESWLDIAYRLQEMRSVLAQWALACARSSTK
jgi:hypothetical protein